MTPGSAGHGQPFEFEQGEYARVRLREDPSREYVIFVHDIYGDGTDSGPEVPRLAVRRYSFLRSAISALVGNAEDLGESWRSRELVLHFRNVKKMGHEDDADLIDLDEIIEAKGLAVGASSTQVDIKHTLPSGEDGSWEPCSSHANPWQIQKTSGVTFSSAALLLVTPAKRIQRLCFPLPIACWRTEIVGGYLSCMILPIPWLWTIHPASLDPWRDSRKPVVQLEAQ